MRLAVVIAANGPESSSDRLLFAENDGLRISDALAKPLCGYEVLRVPGDTPASEARRILLEAAEGCGPYDAFLCYFAGHGRPHEGALLLEMNGTREDRRIATSLAASDMLLAVRVCKARGRVLILDCCNAGQLARQQGVRSGGTAVKELGIESDTFDIVMASGFLEYAFEEEEFGGGFMTSAILEALTTSFNEADADRDRALSFDDAMRWLERRAAEINTGRDRNCKIPVPQRLGFGKGVSYLTRPPTEWIIHEISLPDNTLAVVLPIAPMEIQRDRCAFAMGRYPVVNRRYKRYVRLCGGTPPKGMRYDMEKGWHGPFSPWEDPEFSDPDQPVVCVTAEDALSYCRYFTRISEFKRRGLLALLPPLPEMWNIAVFGNVYESSDPKMWLSVSPTVHHMTGAPAACADAPERISALGLTDLVGNVWEWCGTKAEWITELKLKGQHVSIGVREYWPPILSARHEDLVSWREEYRNKQLHDLYSASDIRQMQRRALRGGGFLDDLTRVSPSIDVERLEHGGQTSHSDLGFRLAAAVRLDSLPTEVAERLEGCVSLRVEQGNLRTSA